MKRDGLPLPAVADQGAVEPSPDMTPRQVVEELDRYIVGQQKAKRAVAIALRNRVRRLKLAPDMA